jgi:hypothetical protein
MSPKSSAIEWRHRAVIAAIAAGMLVAPAAQAADAKSQPAEAKKAAAAKQKIYASPEEAAKELVAAIRSQDTKAATAILGPGSRQILHSGDAVADRQAGERFVRAYDQANKLEKKGDKAMLAVGKDAWPFPVPIVKSASGWRFDMREGREELLNRRIGRNELAVVQVLQAYVDAQREYYLRNPQNDKLLHYAQKFRSAEGKKDGLYYPVKAGEKPSPLGPLVSGARAEGYSKGKDGKPIAYHGYYYRILKAQGPDAPGGAYSYVAHGRMFGGFAAVAWPATYDNSGIFTFIVSHDGQVYQKDLGRETATAVQKITRFNPDKTWARFTK